MIASKVVFPDGSKYTGEELAKRYSVDKETPGVILKLFHCNRERRDLAMRAVSEAAYILGKIWGPIWGPINGKINGPKNGYDIYRTPFLGRSF